MGHEKADRERRELVGALLIAFDHWPEFCDLVWRSPSQEESIGVVASRFGVTATQARAMPELQIRRITQLDRARIKEEYELLGE